MMTMINIRISIYLIDGQVLADEKVFVCQITDDKNTGSVIIIVGAFSFVSICIWVSYVCSATKPYNKCKINYLIIMVINSIYNKEPTKKNSFEYLYATAIIDSFMFLRNYTGRWPKFDQLANAKTFLLFFWQILHLIWVQSSIYHIKPTQWRNTCSTYNKWFTLRVPFPWFIYTQTEQRCWITRKYCNAIIRQCSINTWRQYKCSC